MDIEQEQILNKFSHAVDKYDQENNLLLEQEAKTEPEKKKMKLPLKPWQKRLFISFLVILALFVSVASYTAFIIRDIKKEIDLATPIAFEAKTLLASQNIMALPDKISELKSSKEKIQGKYQKLAFYGKLPFLNNYYKDGQKLFEVADHGFNIAEKGTTALIPYVDLLGFQGEGTFTGGTTQDRIVLILETLKEIQPTIDEIDSETKTIVSIVNSINVNRYPEKIAGKEIRSQLISAQKTASLFSQTFSDYKPVIASLGKMAGAEEAQKYLVLFQNDNELRPTGGFLTAYAIINIDKGVVTSEKSDDIYELDQKFTKKIAIPEVLGKYLTTEKYYHLRDMNISPDFKTSMEEFYSNYITVKGESDDIDGIIAVDTYVLSELLRVIGPIEVAGYGTFSAENNIKCDCPQVVYALSEIITKPTPYIREDRKGVLGPLMKSILAKTYDLDKARFPELFNVAIASIEGRHVQMYFMDENTQKAAEQINAAGRIYELKNNLKGWQMGENMDFLAIVDANLGGAKSNLFTNYEVKQTVAAPIEGRLEKTVEITYKNTRKADNCNLEAGLLCLNSTLNDWLRIYLPQGSELIEIQGISNEASVYEEAGLTVIDGYFNLEPMGLAKIKLSYSVPYTDTVNYNLKMWKQGGIDAVPVLMDVTGGEEQLNLDKDLDYSTIF
ncbi:DUF4012 domain-containing protein [Patescibacteria group bacterium]|nr:DUF4012 domain-containing protein [Patescibacteria group bacterium]